MRPEHYEQTEESLALRQEYEMRRAKQVRDPGWSVLRWMWEITIVCFFMLVQFNGAFHNSEIESTIDFVETSVPTSKACGMLSYSTACW